MQQQAGSDNTQGLKVLLEIVPEDQGNADPVAVGEMGRAVVEELRHGSYTVDPVYTGQRGGIELVFQTVVDFLNTQGGTIDVVASLTTIVTSLFPVLEKVFRANEEQGQPIKISLFIDGSPVSIEAANLKEAEAALKIAERYHAIHPTIAPNPATSQVKVQIPAPKKARRRH